ncbi:MAG: NosD domain-containing protein [Planctomycetota bacterium]
MSGRLCSAGVACLCLVSAAHAATIVVEPGGMYPTIQSGVNAASAGDTVLVYPGTYAEEVVVPISIAIRGIGAASVIVLPATSRPGSGTGSQIDTTAWLFKIRADGVQISNMTLDGDNPALAAPIDARGAVITDSTAGVFNGIVCEALVVKNFAYRGLYLNGGSFQSVVQNQVSNVREQPLDSTGILLFDAHGVIDGNTVGDCSIGIGLQGSLSGGNCEHNAVSACDLGLLCYGSGARARLASNAISSCDQGVQCVAGNSIITVADNTLGSCFFGLLFFGQGTGSYEALGNQVVGVRDPSSVGMFVSTDVSMFGLGDVHLLAGGNTFSNYDFGVVLNEPAGGPTSLMDVTLSGEASRYNQFADNASFNLYLQGCNDNINATFNNWGVISPEVIEQTIWHRVDDPALGVVDFSNTVNFYATVDDDGPADFKTINPAVQALQPGGTVLVMPGRYVEDVIIDRSLNILGSGATNDPRTGTILMGASNQPELKVVAVTGSDVAIDKLTVDGTQPTFGRALFGICAVSVSHLAVSRCAVHTATFGVTIIDSSACSFTKNEVYDFGNSQGAGGGIVLTGSNAVVGVLGSSNYLHDGTAVGYAFNAGSSGLAEGNRADFVPLGYLAFGCTGKTVFHRNQVTNSALGFQAVANQTAVDYLENTILTCGAGFSVYGIGGALHNFIDNHIDTNSQGSSGFYASTSSPLGDGDCRFVMRGSTFTESQYGLFLEETAASKGYVLSGDVDANGDELDHRRFRPGRAAAGLR